MGILHLLHKEPRIKTTIAFAEQVTATMNDIAFLETIVRDYRTLEQLHPDPLHADADARVVSIGYLPDRKDPGIMYFAISDRRDGQELGRRTYMASELSAKRKTATDAYARETDRLLESTRTSLDKLAKSRGITFIGRDKTST